MLKILPLEGAREPYRAPDLVWDGVAGDFAVNPLSHADAPGDLRAEQGLATQVLILLLTDRRVEASELRDGDQNRGWVGDSFDRMEGEDEIGSRLWLLRRSALYEGVEVDAEDYVREALQPLIDQGAVSRIEVSISVDRAAGRLTYEPTLYGRDGAAVFNRRFELLWRQINGVADPLAG